MFVTGACFLHAAVSSDTPSGTQMENDIFIFVTHVFTSPVTVFPLTYAYV